jgi:cell division protein FtsZ
MAEMGKAMMGTGEAEGEDRAMRAAEAAISNPLLEDTNMKGARGLLINITGGSDITLFEMDLAANRIREEVDEEANIMVGMALDESLSGRMRISVVATGIDSAAPSMSQMPKLQVVNGGGAEPVPFPPQAAQNSPQHFVHPSAPQALNPGQGAGYIPQPPDRPLLSAAYNTPLSDAELALDEPVARAATPQPAMQPLPLRTAMPEPVRPEPPKRSNSLFKSMFGFGGAPAQPPAAPARHQEPVMAPPAHRAPPAMTEPQAQYAEPVREPARAAVRPAQIDEIGLEVPAFLRRSGN